MIILDKDSKTLLIDGEIVEIISKEEVRDVNGDLAEINDITIQNCRMRINGQKS